MPNIFVKITIFVDYYLLEYNCFLIVSESGSRVTSPLTAGFITKCSPPPLQQNGKDEREKYNVDSGDALDVGIYNCNVLCVVIITKTNVAKLDRDCSQEYCYSNEIHYQLDIRGTIAVLCLQLLWRI